MLSPLVDVYEQACSDAAVLPNSALACCFAATSQATPLQVLSLSNNFIGPRGLVTLLPVLHECRHTLRSVDLSHSHLGNGSIRMLVRCLSKGGFAALRRLELRGNLLTYQGGKCLVHWCEGLQVVKQARGSRYNSAGETDRRSAAALGVTVPSDVLASSLLSTEYWCDATDVHIDFIGIEDTAMPELLLRALQQRIAAAIARRQARRQGNSSRRSGRISANKSVLAADMTGAADSQQHSPTGTESVKLNVPEGLRAVVEAHLPTLSPVDWSKDDNDEQQHNGGANIAVAVGVEAVAVTEVPKTVIPCFPKCNADMNVFRKPAYDDTSADKSVPGEAEELEVAKDDSGPRSCSSAADQAAWLPLAIHMYDEQQSLSGRRRPGSAAEMPPFLCPSPREDSRSDVLSAISSMRPALLQFTSSSFLDALTRRPEEPSPTQQQQELGRYSSPPAETALNILDKLALEAVDQTTEGGGGKGEDAGGLPLWLEGP